ncbi:hypothetical protein ACFFRL_14675 [Agromyces hippuratus]
MALPPQGRSALTSSNGSGCRGARLRRGIPSTGSGRRRCPSRFRTGVLV